MQEQLNPFHMFTWKVFITMALKVAQNDLG